MGTRAFQRLFAAGAAAAISLAAAAAAEAKDAPDLAGPWELSFDRTGATCRILLQTERSDTGDRFLAVPSACRHAMPGIAAAGRWSAPDDGHLSLQAPGGAVLLTLAGTRDGFTAAGPVGTYTLKPLAAVAADGGAVATAPEAPAKAPAPPPAAAARLETVAVREGRTEPTDTVADLAGRYAVMRDKRDTGCMLTLDRAHAKGGDRAQLAPGCRDQGIVVFDPSSWQIVHGAIVLTARAGHKAKLDKRSDGVWERDPKDGKPLGLKKL